MLRVGTAFYNKNGRHYGGERVGKGDKGDMSPRYP